MRVDALRVDGGWRLEALLHRGRLTEVWRARDTVGRTFAVKRARAERADDRGVAALLVAEHRRLAALDHPHVLASAGLTQGARGPLLVTEYCALGNLVPLLGAPPRRWARIACEIAEALGYLHRRGLVHRDLKPRNVLLRAGDEAVLGDFGLAAEAGRATPRGGGSPEYRPAGLALAARAEPGHDVYAYAVVLHELMTGRLPGSVTGGTPGAVHGLRLDPVPARAWEGVEAWVRAALGVSAAAVGTLTVPPDVLESMLILSRT